VSTRVFKYFANVYINLKEAAMRASERAYRSLLSEIQDGTLSPGTVLAETQQAERLGVSRTPMREAIRRLTAEGLLLQQSARVTVVTGFDADHVRQLFAVRRGLEEVAAREAADATMYTPKLVSRFSKLSHQFTTAPLGSTDDTDHYYRLIDRFEHAIDEAAANTYLTHMLRMIRRHLVRIRRHAQDDPARLRDSAREHATIAAAIAAGDPNLAVHATHVHLQHALNSALAAIDSDPAPAPEPQHQQQTRNDPHLKEHHART
jgi:DNA-binding GntR family transcriptional regulator